MIRFNAKKLAAIAIAQSTEKHRYYLGGVYFEGNMAVATDGHILTAGQDTDSEITEAGIYPISKKARSAMVKNGADIVTIENAVLSVLDVSEQVLHMEPCVEIDGIFPNWKRVCPNELGDSFKGSLSDIVSDKIALTARTLRSKGTPIKITSAIEGAGNLVNYNQNDVFSVAMSMRDEIARELPEWATV